MPPTKMIVGVVISVGILILIAGGLDWVISHPIVPLIVVAAAVAGVVYMVRRKRQRNLV